MNLESKFNFGDTIFYMDGSTPKKSEVIGIQIFQGKAQCGSEMKEVKDLKETKTVYYFIKDRVGQIWEDNCFGTKEELINNLSNQI